ncbi:MULTISPECIES: glycosyltransferase [unclassified Actinobaculum]|uniref:glycosyltransferase n=1 Tax=unclassified Actinobaculum TaxID=2609299 RepID=UPI00196BA806|nr:MULTISPECIES: glycosyltransferase [unclassified Actinobaculum]
MAALQRPAATLHFGGTLARQWVGLIRDAARFRGGNRPDAVIVGYLGHFDVLLARMLFPRARIILDQLVFAADTAQDRGLLGPGPFSLVKNMLLHGIDRAASATADVVVVDTRESLGLLADKQRAKSVVVPVGAQDMWFDAAASPDENGVRPPDGTVSPEATLPSGALSVVFYGLFTPLQGTPTIAKALRNLEARGIDLSVTLIGTGQDSDRVRDLLPEGEHVTVTWHDWIDAQELPRVVAAHDVCLGIFGTTPKALRVVPNKAFQGLAAGCALITSDTQAQREVLGRAPVYVEPGDALALADAIESLTDHKRLKEARVAALRKREMFRPGAVVGPLAMVLGDPKK